MARDPGLAQGPRAGLAGTGEVPSPVTMRFLRHLFRLLREVGEFAWQNKVWWIVPMVIVLLAMALLVFVGQSSAPFVYTLF